MFCTRNLAVPNAPIRCVKCVFRAASRPAPSRDAGAVPAERRIGTFATTETSASASASTRSAGAFPAASVK